MITLLTVEVFFSRFPSTSLLFKSCHARHHSIHHFSNCSSTNPPLSAASIAQYDGILDPAVAFRKDITCVVWSVQVVPQPAKRGAVCHTYGSVGITKKNSPQVVSELSGPQNDAHHFLTPKCPQVVCSCLNQYDFSFQIPNQKP